VLLSLHEFTTNSSGVLITDFINLNGVISTIEGNDELSGFIIRLSWNELSIETQDVHILLEHLLHINLWWLGL
jgi:hypothetical protein